jgi:hypothetical protein
MHPNPLVNAAIQYGAERIVPAIAPFAPLVSYGNPEEAQQSRVTFTQASKIGSVSANTVLLGTLLGFAFDDYFAAKFKSEKGWGPVVGAVAGITATNAIAGASQGLPASAGFVVGGASALLPVAAASVLLGLGTESKTTVRVLAALAGLTVVTGVMRGVTRRE